MADTTQYQPFQIGTQRPTTPMQSAAGATPEAFGANEARDVATIAGAIGDVGAEIGEKAVTVHRQGVDAKVTEAHSQAMMDVQRYNREDLYNRDADTITDMTTDAQKKYEEIRRNYVQKFTGDQQAMDRFNDLFGRTSRTQLGQVSIAQVDKTEKYEREAKQAQNLAFTEEARWGYNSKQILNENEQMIVQNTKFIHRTRPKEVKDAAVDMALNNYYTTVINGAVADKDIDQARQILDGAKGKLKQETVDTLEDTIMNGEVGMVVESDPWEAKSALNEKEDDKYTNWPEMEDKERRLWRQAADREILRRQQIVYDGLADRIVQGENVPSEGNIKMLNKKGLLTASQASGLIKTIQKTAVYSPQVFLAIDNMIDRYDATQDPTGDKFAEIYRQILAAGQPTQIMTDLRTRLKEKRNDVNSEKTIMPLAADRINRLLESGALGNITKSRTTTTAEMDDTEIDGKDAEVRKTITKTTYEDPEAAAQANELAIKIKSDVRLWLSQNKFATMEQFDRYYYDLVKEYTNTAMLDIVQKYKRGGVGKREIREEERPYLNANPQVRRDLESRDPQVRQQAEKKIRDFLAGDAG